MEKNISAKWSKCCAPRRPAPRPQRSGRPESAEIFICLVSWQIRFGGTLNEPTGFDGGGKQHPAQKNGTTSKMV